ncbi:SDR family oxidoreductase [Sphingobium sp. R-7]|uniref:SDR family oxidoreductase n=1 Tax=Sphingobium sp. R-7 TaxID=3375449 RepID=UPI00398B0CF3
MKTKANFSGMKEFDVTGRVEGKIAVVTGAASGMGAAAAQMLAAEGATVVLVDRNEALGVKITEAIGDRASFVKLDVADEEQWNGLAEEIKARHGGLDILVNSAGIVHIAGVEDTSLEDFNRVIAINAGGIFLGCKSMLPLLKKSRHGSIVNIASTASHQGFGLGFAYGASKGAVRTMTKSIAAYCQDRGYPVRCNSIHPNEIETPMMEDVMQRSGRPETVAEGILPPGKLGATSDVAYAILYLASEESRFVTGGELTVDNGSLMRPWATSIPDQA